LLKYFNENKKLLKGRLRVIFQPGEEAAPGGAERVVKEDLWNEVRAVLTTHVFPGVETGKFILSLGPVQASSTSIKIEIKGPGGHTSKPFETVDLINVSGYYITQLQSYLAQRIDNRETVAFAFGAINGGSEHNIIPQSIKLRGTIRTLDNNILAESLDLIRRFSASFEKVYGVKITVQFPTTCPATINDDSLSEKFLSYMTAHGRKDDVLLPAKPSMGADDFAFYQQKAPGLYLGLGAGGEGVLHSGDLILDEQLLEPAIHNMAGFISFLFES
jgi:amidohydrolase